MPAAPRHAKHRAPAPTKRKRLTGPTKREGLAGPTKRRALAAPLGALVATAATLAGVAVVFVSLQGSPAAPKAARDITPVTAGTGSGLSEDRLTTTVHRGAATVQDHMIQRGARAARRKHLAALAAAKLARQQAAARARASQKAAQSPPPSASPSPTPPPSSGGGDAAHSALGDCIRNAEEGGSYAWGPGNGGGAYQFQESTWETYGGAASEYGVAGAAYQDQIFDNAIAAGGASNWTNYDGC
jgi:hypothetical protein